MRRHACALLFVLATNAVAQGQLFLQEEPDFRNRLVEINRPRTARQLQQGYDYPKPTNYLQIPLTVQEVYQDEHHDEQHHDDHHHEDHHGAHSHIHVTRLDVTCDARGMSVELEFSGAFNGVVYSKGHFKNRNCRYVNKDSAKGDFSFVVPMNDCGTEGEDRLEEHETILIIQNEESVQEVWDSAKRVRCPKVTTRQKITKTVTFNPFTVQRLDIDEPKQLEEKETKIECWMDILVGKGPCGSVVQDKVKIGEQLNAVIYIKDGGAQYDILVKDCFAHDSMDLNAVNGTSVQLSDDRGCPKKEKLMGIFQKTEQTCSSGADLVAFAPISAFKFADRPDVFLTCIVELCPGGCDQCPSPSSYTEQTVTPPRPPTPPIQRTQPPTPATPPRTPPTVVRTPPTPPRTQPTVARTPPTPPTPPRTPPTVARTPPTVSRPPPTPPRTQPTIARTPATPPRTPPTPPTVARTPATPPRTPATPPRTPPTPRPSPPIGPPTVQCTPPLRGRYPNCKPAHCEFNPAGPGCGITEEELIRHPFHINNAGPLKPRKRITGARPAHIPHSRRRRDTSKNIVITGVGTGFHFNT